jgi:hypothetical protein
MNVQRVTCWWAKAQDLAEWRASGPERLHRANVTNVKLVQEIYYSVFDQQT